MSATVVIAAASAFSLKISTWVTGSGTSVGAFATGQGYNSLCINGVLQQSGLYSVVASLGCNYADFLVNASPRLPSHSRNLQCQCCCRCIGACVLADCYSVTIWGLPERATLKNISLLEKYFQALFIIFYYTGHAVAHVNEREPQYGDRN